MMLSSCGFVAFTTGRFLLSHALLFVLVLFRSCSALLSPRLWKRELVYVFLVHMFVYVAHVNFSPFSLPLRDWLRLVIVALPGLFYLPF